MQQINHWEKPTALCKEPPRNAKAKLGAIAFPIAILLFIWLMSSFIIFLTIRIIYQEKILRERGVEINSIVVSKTLFQGKSKKFFEIWYQFDLPEKGKTRTIKQKNSIDLDYGESISVSDIIPIIYDKNNPYISRININNKIRSYEMIEKGDSDILLVKAIVSLLCFFSFSLIFCIYRKAHREKSLLKFGKAAPATLIKTKNYSFRDIRLVWLTFHFVDETGVSVHGSYGPYGAERIIHPTAAPDWESKLSNLTVVYDPRDSRKNILYPAHYAELR